MIVFYFLCFFIDEDQTGGLMLKIKLVKHSTAWLHFQLGVKKPSNIVAQSDLTFSVQSNLTFVILFFSLVNAEATDTSRNKT